MITIIKYILIAFLVLIDIACVMCTFKYKPKYPYYFWFTVTTFCIVFLLI